MTNTATLLHSLAMTLLSLITATAGAQNIATDGSLGGAPQVLLGPKYEIGQALGRIEGANLFHSFQRFGLETGELARFRVDSASLSNIFARVTGGEISSIAGTIETAGGTPALFLINPAGVVFSAGARIDVPGGFHVTTADSVRFADGVFAADPASASRLSSAKPEAFGFLGNRLATLRIEGASLGNGDGNFEAIAGDVRLSGGGILNEGGALRVVAFGQQPGEVELGGDAAQAAGTLELASGGYLATLAASGPGGAINVAAGDLQIDGGGVIGSAGIATQSSSAAHAGDIEVTLGGAAELTNGGFVGSTALAGGRAGTVRFTAAELSIDGGNADNAGISSDVDLGASGHGGDVSVVVAGSVRIADGGYLRAGTIGSGAAGSVSLSAKELMIEGGDAGRAGVFSNSGFGESGAAGGVSIAVTDQMSVRNGGRIQSSTFGAGDAGVVSVRAGELALAGGAGEFATIASDASLDSTGSAASVTVSVDRQLSVSDGAFISSSTFGTGDASEVTVTAGDLAIDGGVFGVAGIFSDSNAQASGAAGAVAVSVASETTLRNGGFISSSTFSAARAGEVRVDTGRLAIDGGTIGLAEIRSSGGAGSSGDAGSVIVSVRDDALLSGGGRVRSGSFGTGDGGAVTVRAGELKIEGSGAGFSGILSETDPDASGRAGTVDVAVEGELRVVNGGVILTSALGGGQAGGITMNSARLQLDGGAEGFAGIASTARNGSGSINIAVREDIAVVNGGTINTSTLGAGDAGRITLTANDVVIAANSGQPAGISSDAREGASGGSGAVSIIAAQNLRVGLGGAVSASTFGAGRSGVVQLAASKVNIDGGIVAALASRESSGQTGDVMISASESLVIDNGLVSIENDAALTNPAALDPTAIRVSAPELVLRNDAVISAAASSNADASNVEVVSGRLLQMDTAAIATSAEDGNGGAITLNGSGVISLRNSAIATSVRGERGDGGDIALKADALILSAGFIQANTAAVAASGGQVLIDVGQVIPAGNRVFVGGDQPFSFADAFGIENFNVIQAAAPTGVSGEVRILGTVIDVSGSLVALSLPPIDLGVFARDPCSVGRRNTFVVGARSAPDRASDGFLSVPPTKLLRPTNQGIGCPQADRSLDLGLRE